MRYNTLGKTGLQVSVLGFGASPLGGVFGAVSDGDARRAVAEAIAAGINYFDVAPFYGETKAETVLGNALEAIPRDAYFLATKVGRYTDNGFDFSAGRVARSVDESLQRLGVDYIDVIQCHDIEFGSLDQIVVETLPALRALQQQGKVRFVGISGLPLAIFPAILDRAELDVVLSYCHHTLNDASLRDLLPYLMSKNVGIINASPLAMGLLTERPLPSWHPAPPEIRAACAQAAAYCRSKGVDIARLALQFSVSNPDIATTLVGIGSLEDLRRNVQWISEPLDTALLAEVLAILEPIHNKSWPSGIPENSDYPHFSFGNNLSTTPD